MYVHRKAGVTACVCGACLPSHAQCMHACSITSTLHAGVWGRHKAIRAGARAEERERGKEKMKMKEGERERGREILLMLHWLDQLSVYPEAKASLKL